MMGSLKGVKYLLCRVLALPIINTVGSVENQLYSLFSFGIRRYGILGSFDKMDTMLGIKESGYSTFLVRST